MESPCVINNKNVGDTAVLSPLKYEATDSERRKNTWRKMINPRKSWESRHQRQTLRLDLILIEG